MVPRGGEGRGRTLKFLYNAITLEVVVIARIGTFFSITVS